MNHEQIIATQAMLKVNEALSNLRNAATNVKALHFHNISEEQQRMIESIRNFGYADEIPTLNRGGDGIAWKFDKFIVQ